MLLLSPNDLPNEIQCDILSVEEKIEAAMISMKDLQNIFYFECRDSQC